MISVDCLFRFFRNTHDDLADWSLSRLKYELNTVRESKRHLQKILKDFEHDFEQTMGTWFPNLCPIFFPLTVL